MREGDGMTGVDPQKIEVHKYGHNVPLAEGACQNCGRPVRYNLVAPIVIHVDDGEPNDCRDPWPAARPAEALTGIGVSATTQEAPQRASGDPGARVDGSGASVSVPSEPPELSVALGRTAVVLDEVAAERQRQDARWGEQNHPDGTGEHGHHDVDAAVRAKVACAFLATHGGLTWRHVLIEEVYEAFAETDPTKLRAELVQVAAVAAAWVEAIDRRAADRTTVPADAGTDEFDRLWAELENAPEHPGTGQPTEGAAGEVSRG